MTWVRLSGLDEARSFFLDEAIWKAAPKRVIVP
jgi:hypothetical protein